MRQDTVEFEGVEYSVNPDEYTLYETADSDEVLVFIYGEGGSEEYRVYRARYIDVAKQI